MREGEFYGNFIKVNKYIKEEDIAYINAIDHISKLTSEEIKEFSINNIHNDKTYRKRIIESNLYRVISIALKYISECVEFLDLVEEGNIGLIKAIDNFNYGDYKVFVKCINKNIFYSIKVAIIEKSNLIKIPRYLTSDFYSYKNYFDKYVLDNGHVPMIDEMEKIVGVNYKQSSIYYNLCYGFLSLSETNEEYFNRFELLEDFIEDKLLEEEKRKIIYRAINESNLTDKEKSVIIYSYGMSNKVLERMMIAKKLEISNSRVGQLEKNAIKKL